MEAALSNNRMSYFNDVINIGRNDLDELTTEYLREPILSDGNNDVTRVT